MFCSEAREWEGADFCVRRGGGHTRRQTRRPATRLKGHERQCGDQWWVDAQGFTLAPPAARL